MHVTKGIPASEGFAVGAVRRLRHMQTGLGRAVSSPAREADAYLSAAEAAKAQLDALAAKATADDRDIFTAQRLMLDDQGLTDEILAYIGAGAGAAGLSVFFPVTATMILPRITMMMIRQIRTMNTVIRPISTT